MTSNIGAQKLLDGIDESGNISDALEKSVLSDLHNYFRPEFLNRLDETIIFKPLSKSDVSHIIDLLTNDLNKRLFDRQISIELTDNAKDYIIENGYEPHFGARPIKRFMQRELETKIAKAILEGNSGNNGKYTVDAEGGELVIG